MISVLIFIGKIFVVLLGLIAVTIAVVMYSYLLVCTFRMIKDYFKDKRNKKN